MKVLLVSLVTLSSAALVVGRSTSAVLESGDDFSGFVEVDTFDSIKNLDLDPQCLSPYSGQIATVAITVKPVDGSTTTVSSSPSGIMKFAKDKDTLKTYYEKAALTDKEMDAGVLIEVPRGTLKKVQIGGTVAVTILDGFGSKFEDVQVEDDAVAYLTYNGSGDMELETKDSSSLNAIVSGTDELEVDAKDSSTLVVQGDITEGQAKEEATLKIAEGSTIEDYDVDVKGKKATVIVDSSIKGGCDLIHDKDGGTCKTGSVEADVDGPVHGSGSQYNSCHYCKHWCPKVSNLRIS